MDQLDIRDASTACNQVAIDTMFIATNNESMEEGAVKQGHLDSEKALSRSELLEMMVRLAMAKYIRSLALTDSAAEAFVHFCKHLEGLPLRLRVSTNRFRVQKLYLRHVNTVF